MSEVKDQIKENMRYAKQIFEERAATATDFINKEAALGFISERFGKSYPMPDENAIETMAQHPFVRWLHKDENFRDTQNLIIQRKLCVIKRTNIETINIYLEKFSLVKICALQVFLFVNEIDLDQAVVTQEDRKDVEKAIKTLDSIFDRGGIYLGNGAMQLLLHKLLKIWSKDLEHNPFSSKKRHEGILRQIFIKFLWADLVRTYQDLTRELAVDIALGITAIFFPNNMNKRDAQREVKKIFDALSLSFFVPST